MHTPTNSKSKVKPVVKKHPNGTGGIKPAVKVYKAAKPAYNTPAKPHKLNRNTVTASDINRVKKATKKQEGPKSSTAFKSFIGQ